MDLIEGQKKKKKKYSRIIIHCAWVEYEGEVTQLPCKNLGLFIQI